MAPLSQSTTGDCAATALISMTRIITLTGGRDGQGERRMAADLAIRLAAASERRVCLLALAGLPDMVGAPPHWAEITTLADSLEAEHRFSVLPLATNCDLVVASRDGSWLRILNAAQLEMFAERLRQLGDYDYLLIDAGSGTDQNRLAIALASPELLLTLSPATASLNAAYGRLKLLYAEQFTGSISILITQCDSPAAGRHSYDKLRGIAAFYLDTPLPLAALVGAPEAPGGEAAYAAGLAQLVHSILTTTEATPSPDMTAFSRRFVRAAGVLPAADDARVSTPVFAPAAPRGDLSGQLDLLSTQVDELVAEVHRLRDNQALQQPSPVQGLPPRPVQRCDAACIAAMASSNESVTVAGETFTVYRLQRGDGHQLRFACQSADDDLEQPEPQYLP